MSVRPPLWVQRALRGQPYLQAWNCRDHIALEIGKLAGFEDAGRPLHTTTFEGPRVRWELYGEVFVVRIDKRRSAREGATYSMFLYVIPLPFDASRGILG